MKRIDDLLNMDNLYGSSDEPLLPEIALWRGVILQQVLDAGSNSELRFMKQRKKEAIEWLSGNSSDFYEVCSLANLDPVYVKKQANIALKRKCLWRKYNKNSYTGRKKK